MRASRKLERVRHVIVGPCLHPSHLAWILRGRLVSKSINNFVKTHQSISNPKSTAMKPKNRLHKLSHLVLALGALAFCPTSSDASVAYGSINNFDTVNDTGEETHGFEIEVEDCHSTDVTYTFDYNHYGTSHITQDNSIPGHPKTHIRWESKKNPDGSWAAKTIVPTGRALPLRRSAAARQSGKARRARFRLRSPSRLDLSIDAMQRPF